MPMATASLREQARQAETAAAELRARVCEREKLPSGGETQAHQLRDELAEGRSQPMTKDGLQSRIPET